MGEKKEEIRVTDKRKFDSKGNLKEENSIEDKKEKKSSQNKATTSKPTKKTDKAETKKTMDKQPEKDSGTETKDEHYVPTEVDFLQFILTLYNSVLVSLGEIPDPVSRETVKNIENAKSLIDIIVMLEKKTEGNLEETEKNTIEEIIYQSRMLYLKAVEKIKI